MTRQGIEGEGDLGRRIKSKGKKIIEVVGGEEGLGGEVGVFGGGKMKSREGCRVNGKRLDRREISKGSKGFIVINPSFNKFDRSQSITLKK